MADEPTAERPRARRPLYRGTLAFGLVSIPVALHRAVQKRSIRFHDLHDADGGRIQHRAVCARDGQRISRDHVVKGYQLPDGGHVQVRPEELAALSPVSSHRIVVDAFVDPMEIDPTLYEAGYHLAPAEGAARAYALLRDAMAALHRVGVGRIVLRAREHVCVVRPAGPPRRPAPTLALSLLAYADEVRAAADVPGMPEAVTPTERERLLAERLVERYAARFEPERYRDEHRARVLSYLEQKAQGALVAPPPTPPALPELDLAAALEASLVEAERRPRAA